MKSISNGKFAKVPLDKYYSIDPKIGNTLHMDLVDHNFTYIEPFCGGGDLINQIHMGTCVQAIDVNPEKHLKIAEKGDALYHPLVSADYIISNPPFSSDYKNLFFECLKRFLKQDVKAIYMLIPYNFSCNIDFQWAMQRCESVRPTGRLKWFDDGRGLSDTKDHAWYKFVPHFTDTVTKPRHNAKRITNQKWLFSLEKKHGDHFEFVNYDFVDPDDQVNIKCKKHDLEYIMTASDLEKTKNICDLCRIERKYDWVRTFSKSEKLIFAYEVYMKDINIIADAYDPENRRLFLNMRREEDNNIFFASSMNMDMISDENHKKLVTDLKEQGYKITLTWSE